MIDIRFGKLMAVAGVAVVAWSAPAAAQGVVEGEWEGTIEVQGKTYDLTISFDTEGGRLVAKAEIPERGIDESRFLIVVYDDPILHLELPAGSRAVVFDGQLMGDLIAGVYAEGSVRGTFSVLRASEVSDDR